MITKKATKDNLICTFKEAKALSWQFIHSSNNVHMVKEAVICHSYCQQCGLPIKTSGAVFP